MLVEHLGRKPRVHPTAFVAANALLCGDVEVGEEARVLYGAQIVAEGGSIRIGRRCLVMENAVVRSTAAFSTIIGPNTLIGPHAHLVGCTVGESVFIATGAAVFHGARLGNESEVRINGVVHIRSFLPERKIVPIGWVAVGDPVEILPPSEHDRIWSIQKPLNFPLTVYGVERREDASIMPEVMEKLSRIYGAHREDKVLSEEGD
ncbi:MAG: gamma carbonic anhydrase family protein [Thermodesulfobacteriota bacterium]